MTTDPKQLAVKRIEELAKQEGRAADYNAGHGLKEAAIRNLETARFLVLAATYLKNLND